jgi:hypothetical protein
MSTELNYVKQLAQFEKDKYSELSPMYLIKSETEMFYFLMYNRTTRQHELHFYSGSMADDRNISKYSDVPKLELEDALIWCVGKLEISSYKQGLKPHVKIIDVVFPFDSSDDMYKFRFTE